MEDLRISIEVRGDSPTVVARNLEDTCYRLLRVWHLRIEDRAGEPIFPIALGTWLVHRLGDKAGRGFFE